MPVTPVLVIDTIPLKGRVRKYQPDYGMARLEVVAWAHDKNCECEAHHTFTCDQCGRRVGWCLGGADNMPGACNFCWKPEAP